MTAVFDSPGIPSITVNGATIRPPGQPGRLHWLAKVCRCALLAVLVANVTAMTYSSADDSVAGQSVRYYLIPVGIFTGYRIGGDTDLSLAMQSVVGDCRLPNFAARAEAEDALWSLQQQISIPFSIVVAIDIPHALLEAVLESRDDVSSPEADRLLALFRIMCPESS